MYSRRVYQRQAEIWYERASVYAQAYGASLMVGPAAVFTYTQSWLLLFIIYGFGAVSISFLLFLGAVNSVKAHVRRGKWKQRKG
jgi:hypothetical protein